MAIDEMGNYGFDEGNGVIGEAHGDVELNALQHQQHRNYTAIAENDIEESIRQQIVEAEIRERVT